MSRKTILHMLTPLRQMSPFDVNMALDAGYDHVVPYTDVTLADVAGLVQDAVFSRPPDAGVATGIFIAGRDTILALDPKNPQIAARMATAFRTWRTLEDGRRAKAEAELRHIKAAPGLSRDLSDIVERALG